MLVVQPAPNSALWILADPKVEVVAFEPDLRSVKILRKGKITNQYLDKPRVIENKRIICFKKKIIKNLKRKILNYITAALTMF